MLSRKTTTLFCLCFFLAAIASAAVVGPPRRRTDIASTPGSSQQQRSDHVYEEGSEHEVSPTSGHVLIPRNSGQSNGQSDGQSNEQSSGQTNEQPENPERQDETDITEERLPESIPPGLGPESPFPGSRGSSYSVPATPNAEDDIEYSRGQSNRQSNDVQLSPGTMDNIAESRVARRSLIFKSLGLAIIYGDYVDRIKFLVAVPNENVIYQCWGGINMITPITEFPTFVRFYPPMMFLLPCFAVFGIVIDLIRQRLTQVP